MSWDTQVLLVRLIGGILGISVAYAICPWYDRKDRLREQQDLAEYKKQLAEKYK